MTKHELRAGIVLSLLGLWVAIYGFTVLTIGTVSQPGPGLFPFLSGLGIVVLCGIWIGGSWRILQLTGPFWENRQYIRPGIAVIIILIYAALMEHLGYIITTFLFMVAWQMLVERQVYTRALGIALISTAAMALLFVYLLNLYLPKGILGI